jgi:hypothetical protein
LHDGGLTIGWLGPCYVETLGASMEVSITVKIMTSTSEASTQAGNTARLHLVTVGVMSLRETPVGLVVSICSTQALAQETVPFLHDRHFIRGRCRSSSEDYDPYSSARRGDGARASLFVCSTTYEEVHMTYICRSFCFPQGG